MAGPKRKNDDADSFSTRKHVHKKAKTPTLLPVTLLGGFLGSGKTTLLKHILERKHNSFRCAVIVNDVAELNIDKALIDQSSFVQSEEVIAMENGCVCCTLKSDLVEQIIDMASNQHFDYMIIEASGISEPSEIARIFSECDDNHDHDAEHGDNPSLYDVARLDTCVTLVDAADFSLNLESISKSGTHKNNVTYAKLMVEQIEYSNVVVVNKTDLVSKAQIDKVTEHVALLNPNAKILTAEHSNIDMKEVVDTKLYNAKDFESILSHVVEVEEVKECCKDSVRRGESPCCRRARTIDSGLSQIMLSSKKLPKTRHERRFGITSFLYKARRPFHTSRFHEDFINKYFMFIQDDDDDDDDDQKEDDDSGEEQEEKKKEDGEDQELAEPEEMIIQRQQQEIETKSNARVKDFGNVIRSKGFVWAAHSHDIMVTYSQAGNALDLSADKRWNVLDAKAWTGTEEEKAVFRKDFVDPWGDRRQELVFIGQDIKHEAIQKTLDACLLTDEEFAMGVDGWKATIGDMFLNE